MKHKLWFIIVIFQSQVGCSQIIYKTKAECIQSITAAGYNLKTTENPNVWGYERYDEFGFSAVLYQSENNIIRRVIFTSSKVNTIERWRALFTTWSAEDAGEQRRRGVYSDQTFVKVNSRYAELVATYRYDVRSYETAGIFEIIPLY